MYLYTLLGKYWYVITYLPNVHSQGILLFLHILNELWAVFVFLIFVSPAYASLFPATASTSRAKVERLTLLSNRQNGAFLHIEAHWPG